MTLNYSVPSCPEHDNKLLIVLTMKEEGRRMEGTYLYLGPSCTYPKGLRLERNKRYKLVDFVIDDKNVWFVVIFYLDGKKYSSRKRCSMFEFKSNWIKVK